MLTQNAQPTLDHDTSQADYHFWILLVGIVLMAGAIRLYRLDAYPQDFNQDEAVMGYDAWSIWQTGRDQHGEFLPVYFRTFNDFVPPVANYITAPFVGLLGLDEFSTRLPVALLNIASVGLVALLGRRWFGPAAGLIAALLMAIDPWHVNYSRIAFPTSYITFFTVIALYAFTRAAALWERHSGTADDPIPSRDRWLLLWLALSGLSFALLTGTYPTMKVQAPLLFVACVLAALPALWHHRWLVVYWAYTYLFFALPLLVGQVLDWNTVQTRFTSVSAFSRPNWPVQTVRLYAEHFSPWRLFGDGYGGGIGVRPQGVGEFFWLEGMLWIAAVVAFFRTRKPRRLGFNLAVLLLFWAITFPVADSLTLGDGSTETLLGHPHELRAFNVIPLPELVAGLGAVVLWQALKRYRLKLVSLSLAHVYAVAGAASLLVFASVFLSYFFGPPYTDTVVPLGTASYRLGLRQMIEVATREAQPCDEIWFQPALQTYMYYLFMTRYPPARFQQYAVNHVGQGSFSIHQIDQVHFGVPEPAQTDVNGQANRQCTGSQSRLFYLTRDSQAFPTWPMVATFRNKDGLAVWRLLVDPDHPTPATADSQTR